MRTVQDLKVCVKFILYQGENYFKALRRMAVFPFVFSGLRRLKLSEWLKFNSRQILRQRNCLFHSGLYPIGLKSQII
jgi:hypothetical protein